MTQKPRVYGYLPDERPPFFMLLLYAFQQIIVMFPATVLVALLTGFHVSTTIFASGLATICFVLVTGRKIPLFYGSSFSYILAITSITGVQNFGEIAPDALISEAQFGIVMSGLVSIIAGLIIRQFGQKTIDKILPATVTGSIALVIGLSLAGNAMKDAITIPRIFPEGAEAVAQNYAWIIALVTLLSTIILSVYLKGAWAQVPILLGLLIGYATAYVVGLRTGVIFVDFDKYASLAGDAAGNLIALPHFTFPKASWRAVAAIMPIAIATIPESTAHLYQLDIYVNNLAKHKGSSKRYKIADKLGLNLIGDGLGDIISGAIGGPAGTNYGENISTMAVTKNFSTPMLMTAAIMTMLIACITPLSAVVYSIPTAVTGGLAIYLFGVIGAQGITIMISKKVDMFSAKNLAVIATIMIIGLGGSYAFNGMIPFFGAELPAIATAAIFGIVLNFILSFKKETANTELDEDVDTTDTVTTDSE